MLESVIIDLNASDSEYADIKQCLDTLYSTRAGAQPMARDFGLDYDGIVSLPIDVAKNQLTLEIIEKTEKYEPRVEVTAIDYEVDASDGRIVPIIHVRRKEEADDE